MQRRHLLKLAASAPLALLSTRLLAAPRGSPRLLVVFMRGAYDCNSLLVPISSDFYYESRPSIAIARPGQAADPAVSLTDGWGLHPGLKDTLLRSEEHTSELQSLMRISYAVFCLKKKNNEAYEQLTTLILYI